MKKLLTRLIFIILTIVSLSSASVYGQGQGQSNYALYIQGEKPYNCYINYYINDNNYRLQMPCTYEEMIMIDNAVFSGQLSPDNYYYKIVKLNYHLLRNGYEPLYY